MSRHSSHFPNIQWRLPYRTAAAEHLNVSIAADLKASGAFTYSERFRGAQYCPSPQLWARLAGTKAPLTTQPSWRLWVHSASNRKLGWSVTCLWVPHGSRLCCHVDGLYGLFRGGSIFVWLACCGRGLSRGVSLTCWNGSGRCYVDLQSRSIDGGDQRWSGCPLPLLELAQT